MSALAARVVEFDPLRDKSYQHTRLGSSVVEYLAWLKTGGATESTLVTYEWTLSRACKMFPRTSLEEFSDAQMLHVAASFSGKQRRARVATYRGFFKWALGQRKITLNPCDALPRMKKQPKKVYDLFTDAEIAILSALPVRDGALFTIMFEAGPRKGDCRNLRYRDWLPAATPTAPYGMLVFREGKGGKDRQVQATEPVARALSELAILDGLSPNDYLWYTRPGGSLRVDRSHAMAHGSFERWWRKCLTEAHVRYRNPHMTRHTFSTRFLRRGGRLETLRQILGHESIATTSMYEHLNERDIALDLGLLRIVPD